MEIEAWIIKRKVLYQNLLCFLESESNFENEFEALTKIIDDQEIAKNRKSFLEIFLLLYIIGDNHHRTITIFNRLGLILEYLSKSHMLIDKTEIINMYKSNKRLLLLLFEHKVIIPDDSIIKYLMKIDKTKGPRMIVYLFSEIKDFLDEETIKNIENEIKQEFNENIETFEFKIKQGENDSPICTLIRQDKIQEFVSYVNQTNISLTSTIEPDFYESNSFLINNKPNLIEYAIFYGSIQIIKYLQNNKVKFTPKIWSYAIHSNNPEIIEFLENNKIELEKDSVIESIKCHHNDITDYLLLNIQLDDDIIQSIVEFYNYNYFPNDIISMISNPQNEKFKIYHFTSYLNHDKNQPNMLYLHICSPVTQITIPSSITVIESYAFGYCSSLEEIRIPSSVTLIKKFAFEGCVSLTQITIPSSVTEIEEGAFYRCVLLKQISIPSSLSEIGLGAFEVCSRLLKISIPSHVKSIKNSTFSGCSSLIQISFEFLSSLNSIGDFAFCECLNLQQISLPSTVASIGEGAFKGCSKLKQILIPSFVSSIGSYAFYECSSLMQISIPSNVTEIEKYSFFGCSSLEQILIPSSVISIGEFAFSGCSSLEEILIPSSVTEIGNYAFEKCSLLKQVNIPSSVTLIGFSIFSECSSLEQITIPSSVTEIRLNSFKGCSSLTQITIPSSMNLENIQVNSNVHIKRI